MKTAKSLMLLGEAFCALFLSTPASAQDNGWSSAYDSTCTNGNRTYLQNLSEILAPGSAKVSIAHRGVYSVSLPGTIRFPAENTILAFQYAQCKGFPAVEVDLKFTSDGELLVSHDKNFMRFSSFDYNNGSFDPAAGAEIRYGVDTKRPFVGNYAVGTDSLTWSTIRQRLTMAKTYNNSGDRQASYKINNPDSYRLESVLATAKSDYTLNRLVWVLDVQDNKTLNKAWEIVHNLTMHDRVIFKLWTDAIPMRRDSSGKLTVDLPLTCSPKLYQS